MIFKKCYFFFEVENFFKMWFCLTLKKFILDLKDQKWFFS